MAFFQRLGRWYGNSLKDNPILTQSATSGVLFATGDTLAQRIGYYTSASSDAKRQGKNPNPVSPRYQHDWHRTGTMALFGGALLGPTMAVWYRFLQRRVQLRSHTQSVIVRVLADQIAFAPLSIVGLFGYTEFMNPCRHESALDATLAKTQDSLVPVLLQNYKLWPTVQFLNFFFVPLNYRLLVSNIVGVFWSAYLSTTANSKKERDATGQFMAVGS